MVNYLLHFLRFSKTPGIRFKPEELICVQFRSYLTDMTLTKRCKCVWFHVSNEGSGAGKAKWGARQRNMGKLAGVSDYVFMGNGINLALEIKDGNKPLQPSQKDFQKWCKDSGVPYEVAKSLDEAIYFVEKHKIVT